MQDLKICLVQANQAWEDKLNNYNNYALLLEDVNADIILLPEMFNTGFSMNTSLSESFNDSDGIHWLKKMAKAKNAAIYTSLIINEEEMIYNRGVFVEPEGHITAYDKRKTFGLAGEGDHYTSGNRESIVEYKGWKFQLQICYDLRFPEIVRNKMLPNHSAAYDVILYVANWPSKRNVHWKALLQARAIENQCFVAAVNRVGKDANNIEYSGDSGLIDALGNVQFAPSGEEIAQTFVMNWNELEKTREILPFLRDRQ